jgi:hypothetical protein
MDAGALLTEDGGEDEHEKQESGRTLGLALAAGTMALGSPSPLAARGRFGLMEARRAGGSA